jgi:tetratricopeptide (TPR) repeat protein
MSYVSAVTTTAVVLWLAGSPRAASAQTPFLDAVRDLAAIAAASTAPADIVPRRAAALARLRAAIGDWDRSVGGLESRNTRELRGATDERAFQLRVELGLAYRQRGRLSDALREFDAAAALQRNASDVHVLRALTLDAGRSRDEASRAFRTAWLRDAANPIKAYLALMPRSALDASERARAGNALQEAFTRPPARAAAFLVLDPVPDTLSRTPVVGDAMMADVFAQLAEGRLDDALRRFSAIDAAAAHRDDDSPLAHFERGRAQEIEGQQATARQSYRAALAGTLSGRHLLYVGIGRLAQVEGDFGAATEAFVHAVLLNPNDPVIHRELAGAYAAAGRTTDALNELAAALLLNPRDVDAMAAAGDLLLDSNRAADAIALLNRAVDVNPDRAQTRYALAVALSRAGRTDDAARQFDIFARMSRDALDERRREVSGQAGPATTGPGK